METGTEYIVLAVQVMATPALWLEEVYHRGAEWLREVCRKFG